MSERSFENISQAEIAEEVERFLQQPVGKYLIRRVGADLENLRDKLEAVNPYWPGAARKMKKIHAELTAVRRINGYLVDMISMATYEEPLEE